jgi:hypothetical protein
MVATTSKADDGWMSTTHRIAGVPSGRTTELLPLSPIGSHLTFLGIEVQGDGGLHCGSAPRSGSAAHAVREILGSSVSLC